MISASSCSGIATTRHHPCARRNGQVERCWRYGQVAVVPDRVALPSDGPHITVHVLPHSVTVQPVTGHWTAHTVAVAQLTVVVDDVCAWTLHGSPPAHVTSQGSPAAHCTMHVGLPPVHVWSHGSLSAHWQLSPSQALLLELQPMSPRTNRTMRCLMAPMVAWRDRAGQEFTSTRRFPDDSPDLAAKHDRDIVLKRAAGEPNQIDQRPRRSIEVGAVDDTNDVGWLCVAEKPIRKRPPMSRRGDAHRRGRERNHRRRVACEPALR